jgi:hypothetical protein
MVMRKFVYIFNKKIFCLSRIGFPEMPDLSLKVTPVFGESKYSNTLIHDFLEARIRDELKVSLKISKNRIFHFRIF